MKKIDENSEDHIRTLEWWEHIRLHPCRYDCNPGDGSSVDDGIYVLIKGVLDNSVNEHLMGFGNKIIIDVTDEKVTVRDFGRGIPLGKLVKVVSKMNTGGMYDSQAFAKSIGLNGVGIKAVNTLSTSFEIRSVRDGQMKTARFECGKLLEESPITACDEPNGTFVQFIPDASIFCGYRYREEFIIPMLKDYTYSNTGLTITFNGKSLFSNNGLIDLLREKMHQAPMYSPIHLSGDNIEVTITHVNNGGEEYYSFVNGHYTVEGGTHLSAFKKAVVHTLKKYFHINSTYSDILNGIIAVVSIKVEDPYFETFTKTKFATTDIEPYGQTVSDFIGSFIHKELVYYLQCNPETADIILNKIQNNKLDRN